MNLLSAKSKSLQDRSILWCLAQWFGYLTCLKYYAMLELVGSDTNTLAYFHWNDSFIRLKVPLNKTSQLFAALKTIPLSSNLNECNKNFFTVNYAFL